MQKRLALVRVGWIALVLAALSWSVSVPPVSAQPAAPLTNWLGTAHDGLQGAVFAIAFRGDDVYVGGDFNETRDGQISGFNNVARWDGAAWHLLDLGLNGPVYALAFDSQGDLYVGGSFDANCANVFCTTSDETLENIARWDGSAWSRVKFGVDAPVHALLMDGSDNLYMAGEFQSVCGNKPCTVTTPMNRIVKYDGTAWHSLGFGLDNTVLALALSNSGELFAGGRFSSICANDDCLGQGLAYRIARFKNGAWSALPLKGMSHDVTALAFVGNALYVGGLFQSTLEGGGTPFQYIAKFSSEAWSALPHNGLSDRVYALLANGSDLYVAGEFTETNDGAVTGLNHIARFTNGAWHALPATGLDGWVSALGVQDAERLYAGGGITATADGSVTEMYALAHVAVPDGCTGKPVKPTLKKPTDGKFTPTNTVTLKWNMAGCADTYTVIVRVLSTGELAYKAPGLTALKHKTDTLTSGIEYQWFIKACNTGLGCRKSVKWRFTVP